MDIHLKEISHSFEKQPIFNDVTFHFKKGFFYLLKGDSGCGKSTLLKMIVKLIELDQGNIEFTCELAVTELRRQIQLLPQLPVIFPGTVEENLLMPFSLPAYESLRPDDIEVDRLLERLFPEGMDKQKKASTLSQGQKQRLAIGRMFLIKPQVLLCDEPTSALDATSRKIVEEMINDFFDEDESRLVIYISHHEESFIKTAKLQNLIMSNQNIEVVQ